MPSKKNKKKALVAGVLAYPNDSAASRQAEWVETIARAQATLGDRVAGFDYRSRTFASDEERLAAEEEDFESRAT